MSRDDEDRILHGLYYHRENIDEDVQVSREQLLWLAMHPLREGDAWRKDGKLQSVDAAEFPEEIRGKLITAKLELPLRYLRCTQPSRLQARIVPSVFTRGGVAWICGTGSTETASWASPSPS